MSVADNPFVSEILIAAPGEGFVLHIKGRREGLYVNSEHSYFLALSDEERLLLFLQRRAAERRILEPKQ